MNTRDRIVSAAAEVIRSRGLARATTKEIARAAGYSEAALYKHFRDKTDIFLAVLGERGPTTLGTVLGRLPERVGTEPVAVVLQDVAVAAADFYDQGFPMAASIFSEPTLLQAHRTALRERGAGPQAPGRALTAYLAAEQKLGRISADIDPATGAGLLLGACLQRAFLSHFTGPPETDPGEPTTTKPGTNKPGANKPGTNQGGAGRPDGADDFVTTLVNTLLRGLAP